MFVSSPYCYKKLRKLYTKGQKRIKKDFSVEKLVTSHSNIKFLLKQTMPDTYAHFKTKNEKFIIDLDISSDEQSKDKKIKPRLDDEFQMDKMINEKNSDATIEYDDSSKKFKKKGSSSPSKYEGEMVKMRTYDINGRSSVKYIAK